MSSTVSLHHDIISESVGWDDYSLQDVERNEQEYALSHHDGDTQWTSPILIASSGPSTTPQAIPINELNDSHHDAYGYGYHSNTYSGYSHHPNTIDLAGITASPSQQPTSIDSSWHEAFMHHSYLSGLGSGDSFGNSFGNLPTVEWSTTVKVPLSMHRSNSDSSQEAVFSQGNALETEPGESFDTVDDTQHLGTSFPISDIFQLDDVENNTGNTRRIGRQRQLTPQERRDAHLMRRLGACQSCKGRKIKCDPGIPCKRCVIYYGDGLIRNPCRGDQLHGIAECMIKPNTFPRGDPDRFIRDGYSVDKTDYAVRFDLGFGSNNSTISFLCRTVVAQDGTSTAQPLIHKHMAYPWPPQSDASQRTTTDDLVFPAKLADGQNLEQVVENYLTELLRPENFLYFPLYSSQLNVLLGSYWLYRNSSQNQTQPLENALKLLVLVHQGGDLRVRKDTNSFNILSQAYGGAASSYENIVVTPCLVRSQLGPVFSCIAHKLMRAVLKELETLSQVTDSARFPVILATFSVLCMALESLQYHISKLPYHCHLDDPRIASVMQPGAEEPMTRDLSDSGADILLRFYKGTKCHDRLEKLGTGAKTDLTFSLKSLFAPEGFSPSNPAPRSRRNSLNSRQRNRSGSGGNNSSRTGREPAGFLDGLHNAVSESREYLQHKAQLVVVPYHDMKSFFDRILARMYLLDPEPA